MNIYKIKSPFIFTIFGASGDLAKLKIFPAIFALAEQKRFPEHFIIGGYARSKKSESEFREIFKKSVEEHYKGTWGEYQEGILKNLLNHVFYFSGQYDDKRDFQKYKDFLQNICGKTTKDYKTTPHLNYFSVPPFVVEPIMQNMAEIFDAKTSDIRLILEKPFGESEASASKIINSIHQFYRTDQLYLLDHYLGKKAVRSLIPLRHMNRILNNVIQGKEIANIQISAIEPMGVGKRIGYFNKVGTIKDVIQSHLLQILAMTTMSIPLKTTSERIQEERASILKPLDFEEDENNISLGQYEGYQEEVSHLQKNSSGKNSQTETFAAVKLMLNRESWHGVPIFLRTGKHLHEKHTFLVIELKKFSFQPKDQEPNRVIIEFYPEEKIQIRLLDEDGATLRQGEITASESIACHGDYCLPEHGLLFIDVMRNEKRYFLDSSEILASWHITDKILKFMKEKNLQPEIYKKGSQGPKNQDNLMKNSDFKWYDPHN